MKNIVCRNAHSARSETDGNFIAHTVRLIHRTIKRFLPAHYADRGAKIREWLLIGRRRELRTRFGKQGFKNNRCRPRPRGWTSRLFIVLMASVFPAICIYLFDFSLVEHSFTIYVEFHLQLWMNLNRKIFSYILKFNM